MQVREPVAQLEAAEAAAVAHVDRQPRLDEPGVEAHQQAQLLLGEALEGPEYVLRDGLGIHIAPIESSVRVRVERLPLNGVSNQVGKLGQLGRSFSREAFWRADAASPPSQATAGCSRRLPGS
jgi:hypothetical protein